MAKDMLVGRVGGISSGDVMDALSAVTEGRIFDLDCGRARGMPQAAVHPPYQLLTYRTPAGFQREGDLWDEGDEVGMSFLTEFMVSGLHIGTHLDALGHAGSGDTWFGGFKPAVDIGDHGLLKADAASIPPIISKGVLLDAAAHMGVEHLEPSQGLDAKDLQAIAAAQGVEIPRGGAVMIRTGAMVKWGDTPAYDAIATAGPTLDAARWLVEEHDISVIGSDTTTVEQMPSSTPGHPAPVHDFMLRESGVHLLEVAWLESLSQARVYEFCFICLPLKIEGATASMVRPVALV